MPKDSAHTTAGRSIRLWQNRHRCASRAQRWHWPAYTSHRRTNPEMIELGTCARRHTSMSRRLSRKVSERTPCTGIDPGTRRTSLERASIAVTQRRSVNGRCASAAQTPAASFIDGPHEVCSQVQNQRPSQIRPTECRLAFSSIIYERQEAKTFRLIAMPYSQSFSDSSAKERVTAAPGLPTWIIPALLTRTSIRPNRARTCCTIAWAC